MFDVTLVILIAIGIGGGVFGSVIGVGGGIIFTPALTLMGIPPARVAGTSLLAVTFTSVSSVISYARQKRILYEIAWRLAVLSIPGAILGAYISTVISIDLFKLFFSILLVVAVIYILFGSRIRAERDEKKSVRNFYPLAYFLAFSAGIVSSLFGVGGGIMFVPILLIIMNMNMKEAAPTSQFIIMISAVSGLIVHVLLGNPDYVYALSLAVGAFAGAAIGAEFLSHLRERLLRILLSISLLVVSGRLIYDMIDDL